MAGLGSAVPFSCLFANSPYLRDSAAETLADLREMALVCALLHGRVLAILQFSSVVTELYCIMGSPQPKSVENLEKTGALYS